MTKEQLTYDDIDIICDDVESMMPTEFVPTVEELKKYEALNLPNYISFLVYLSNSLDTYPAEKRSNKNNDFKEIKKCINSIIENHVSV